MRSVAKRGRVPAHRYDALIVGVTDCNFQLCNPNFDGEDKILFIDGPSRSAASATGGAACQAYGNHSHCPFLLNHRSAVCYGREIVALIQ